MISGDDLRYFLVVAQRRRLVLAASQLGVDHTTVGRRVANLERSVGHRLFDRTPAGWELTEVGRRLLPAAESVDLALAEAEELSGTSRALSGTVRLACPDGFGAFLLAPALGPLSQRNPELIVEVVTATQHLATQVREFDLAVTLEEPLSPRIQSRPLTDYVLRLYASRNYLSARPPVGAVTDLAQHVLIWYVDHLLDVPPLRKLHEMLPVQARIQSTNIVAQWQAAAAGVGIAPLPQYIARSDPRLVPVLPDLSFRRRYWLALPSEHARLGRVRAVVDVLDRLVHDRRGDLVGALPDLG